MITPLSPTFRQVYRNVISHYHTSDCPTRQPRNPLTYRYFAHSRIRAIRAFS